MSEAATLGRLAGRAEVMKLARLLELPAGELAYLEQVSVSELRRLREQVTDVMFDGGGGLGRLAAASRLLPAAVIAKIGEHAFGAVLAARIAGLLEPARAADVAARLPTPFLAEVAIHLDPRRAADLLARIPAARIAEVAGALAAAGEHVTLGQFVGHLPDASIAAALREMDDLTVLHVAFVLEDPSAIDRLVALMDDARLEGLGAAAAGSELWPDVLELLGFVSEPRRGRILGELGGGRG